MQRKSLLKFHSWFALVAFLPLLVMSFTGSLLVFKQELDTLLLPNVAEIDSPESTRQSLDLLAKNINNQFPDYAIGTWELFDDGQRADAVYLVKLGTYDWFKVFLDPYKNQVLSTPVALTHYLTDWLVELHYTFLLGLFGTSAGIVFGFCLIALGITGLWMHRQVFKTLLNARWGKAKVALFSDLHKGFGALSAPVLLILGVTGTYWNISAVVHEVEEHMGDEAAMIMQQQRYSEELSLQQLLEHSKTEIAGFKPTYVSLAHEPEHDLLIYGWVPTGNPLLSQYASGIAFDPQTGIQKYTWDIRERGFLAKFLDSFRELHFGTFAGNVSRVIWAVLGAAPLLLMVTGLFLWAKRKRFLR